SCAASPSLCRRRRSRLRAWPAPRARSRRGRGRRSFGRARPIFSRARRWIHSRPSVAAARGDVRARRYEARLRSCSTLRRRRCVLERAAHVALAREAELTAVAVDASVARLAGVPVARVVLASRDARVALTFGVACVAGDRTLRAHAVLARVRRRAVL